MAAGEIAVPPFAGRERAFLGIEARLWGTLDDGLPVSSLEFQKNPQAYRVALARQRSFKEVAVFRPEAVWAVLLDCQHLSVMTIATVGLWKHFAELLVREDGHKPGSADRRRAAGRGSGPAAWESPEAGQTH